MIALDLSGKTMQQCLIWPWTTVTMRCCWTGNNTQVRKPDAHPHAKCKPMALLRAGCQVLSAECSTRQNQSPP